MNQSRRNILLITVIILLGVGVYASNLNNKLFWDDDDWIKNNVFVHDLSHFKEIFSENILAGIGLNSNYYRPALLVSFAFNYLIHGTEPLGYHLVNNGFHIANGILIFLILFYVFRRRLPAFLAAVLFIVHPLQTEAVTYISGRGDPMSVFFMLLALWLFMKARDLDRKMKKFWLLSGGSVLSIGIAVLSRETAVIFPLLLMVFYVSFLSKNGFWKSIRHAFLKSIPFFAVAAVYGILRLTILNFQNTLNFYSQANEYTAHLSYRLFTFGRVLVDYFRLLFFPLGLHMEREIPVNTSFFQWPVWLAGAVCIGILIVVVKKFKTDRILFFAWAWFFLALAPVSGIVPINAIMYEHWLYLPLVGLAALAGFYIDKLFTSIKNKNLKIAAYFLIVGYISFLAILSVKRNAAWGNPIAFYEDILRYNPNYVRIVNNLVNLYSEKGELSKAEEAYGKVISLPGGDMFAQPYYNLGNIYRDRGEIKKAVDQYKKAIEVDPGFVFAYQNLAVIYANQKDLANAAFMLEKTKELKPEDPTIYYNLALIYLAQKKNDLVLRNLEDGLRFSKNNPEADKALRYLFNQLTN